MFLEAHQSMFVPYIHAYVAVDRAKYRVHFNNVLGTEIEKRARKERDRERERERKRGQKQ